MTSPLRRCAGALLTVALAAVLVAGCDRAQEETRLRFTAMGTLVDVTIYGGDPAAAQAAGSEVERMFHELHRAWDPWGDGALGRLNTELTDTGTGTPDPELLPLLKRAADISRATSDRFDPSIGGLIRLWGFSRDDAHRETPPDPEEIRAALQHAVPLPEALAPDGTVHGLPGMALDLGGFAKGVAVQRAVDLLVSEGMENVIVNAGGDLRAVGRHGDRPWRVGVREPRGPGVLAVVDVSGDESVFTSGDYERFFMFEGTRYHHILDPRTGYPARGLTSVTVIHPDAGLADAAATALFVAGPEDWPEVATSLGVDKVMVVTSEGSIEMTPAMQSRLKFPQASPPQPVVRPLP